MDVLIGTDIRDSLGAYRNIFCMSFLIEWKCPCGKILTDLTVSMLSLRLCYGQIDEKTGATHENIDR
jgi:hypothetical protein